MTSEAERRSKFKKLLLLVHANTTKRRLGRNVTREEKAIIDVATRVLIERMRSGSTNFSIPDQGRANLFRGKNDRRDHAAPSPSSPPPSPPPHTKVSDKKQRKLLRHEEFKRKEMKRRREKELRILREHVRYSDATPAVRLSPVKKPVHKKNNFKKVSSDRVQKRAASPSRPKSVRGHRRVTPMNVNYSYAYDPMNLG